MEKYYLGYNKTENFIHKLKNLIDEGRYYELLKRGLIYFRNRIIRERLQFLFFRMFNRKKIFSFQKEKYEYLINKITFFNERMVEVPIFRRIIEKNKDKKILEVGHVLHNFFPITHDVLDKYESSRGVINEDIATFNTPKKYDLVISISTLEHVGWDEDPREPEKIIEAFKNLKNITKKGGQIIFSVPWGYNSVLDRLIIEKNPLITESLFLKKIRFDEWKQTTLDEMRSSRYKLKVPCATGIVVGIIKN